MKYDVVYTSHDEIRVEPHYCRMWDNDVGCYGYNDLHGETFEEAKKDVVEFYRARVEYWLSLKEENLL